MYRFSSSWKKHGTFWWLHSSPSEFANKPFKHMKLIQCLEVHHQLRAGPTWESLSRGELFCSVVQSPAGDTASADPRALLDFMGGSKPPEFVFWSGMEFSTADPQKTSSKPSLLPDESSPVSSCSQESVTAHTQKPVKHDTYTIKHETVIQKHIQHHSGNYKV